jgi:hypothetical protein
MWLSTGAAAMTSTAKQIETNCQSRAIINTIELLPISRIAFLPYPYSLFYLVGTLLNVSDIEYAQLAKGEL